MFTMMKNKGKRLVVLLIAACMILSMFSGMTVSAATDAEIYATTNTIKKVDGKYYYVNASGKMDKKTGWKKVAGKYTYYVGSKSNVTVKITKGKYYKWSDGQFKKQPVKKNSTKTIKGKAFYVNKNGNIEKKTGWKKIAGKYAYYVNSNGVVSLKITGGNYQKWSNGQFKKQSLEKYNGKIITIGKKAFYVSEDKIVRKTGWKRVSGAKLSSITNPRGYYVGTKGSVLYKETAKGTYEITSVGKVSDKLMKNGWNGSVFVKNGKVQIKTTVTVGGYINVFNKDGKRVTLKKSGNKIVRSDTNEPVTTKGAYKVGSGSNKQTYYVTNNGNIKKNGTVTVNGVKYTVDASGKCTKVTENGSGNSDGSGNDGEQNSGTNGNQDQQSHVCKWKLVMNSSLSPVKTNYKEHAAVTKTVNKKIRDAYDEKVYSEHEWFCCNGCSKDGLKDQDCSYETYEELEEHQASTAIYDENGKLKYKHGGWHTATVIVDTIHHDAVYADVEEVVEKEWSEWDQTYKCTVCGDTMTEHVVCGATENTSMVEAYIPNKSGELVDDDGKAYIRVTAKKPYTWTGSVLNKKLSADEFYKTYGYVYIGSFANYTYIPNNDYMELLKAHGFIK